MLDILSDLFHNAAYFGNWPDRLFTLFVQAARPSKGGRFGELVQFKVPYTGKNEKAPPVSWVTDHLERGGVSTFLYLHDANYMYFSVRKSQEKQARWLYDEETMQMRSFAHPWSNKSKGKAQSRPARQGRKSKGNQTAGVWGLVESLLK